MAGAAGYFLLMLGMALLVIIIADIATACGCCGTDCDVGHQFYIPTIVAYIIAGLCILLGAVVLGIVVCIIIIIIFLLVYTYLFFI